MTALGKDPAFDVETRNIIRQLGNVIRNLAGLSDEMRLNDVDAQRVLNSLQGGSPTQTIESILTVAESVARRFNDVISVATTKMPGLSPFEFEVMADGRFAVPKVKTKIDSIRSFVGGKKKPPRIKKGGFRRSVTP